MALQEAKLRSGRKRRGKVGNRKVSLEGLVAGRRLWPDP